MKIQTLLSPLNADELYFTKKTTIVIDVLRATTTIVTALANGAKEVIPVNTIEFAMKVSGNAFGGHTLLGGERNTKKIDGFALGNSPLEYSKEIVKGKSIVLFTTNGSKAIVKSKFSKNLIIGSFLNANAVAQAVVKMDSDIEILCSGNNGMFSYEDSMCAGSIISHLKEIKEELALNDASEMCLMLFNKNRRRLKKAIAETEHGTKLIENGFNHDVKACSELNSATIVPYYLKGAIKILMD